MGNDSGRHARYALVAAVLILTSGEAAAQEADTRTVGGEDQPSLEEIIVTAERVETNLQRTPIAVTALSAEALRDRGVTNLLDLNSLAPNVSVGSRSGSGAASGAITIRGIGVDASPPASPAVGIYIDEVYYPGSFGNLIGMFDLSRVEVLRGPQGTLFGRNTISGAIQYVSTSPRLDRVAAFAEGTIGNLDRREFSAGINLPLGHIAALRVSGAIRRRDGYVYDRFNKINRGSDNNDQIRAQLRLKPNDRLTIDIKGEYLNQRSNGRATTAAGFNYATVFAAPYAATRGLDRFLTGEFYETGGANGPEFFKATLKVAQARIVYDLSDAITLKSISAYTDNVTDLSVDQDGTPLSIIHVQRGLVHDKLFTQEFQLSGRSFGDRLRWTLGAYYYDDTQTTRRSASSIFGGPYRTTFGDYDIDTISVAIYGQATFNLTERLAVVGGLRFTREDIDAFDAGLAGASLSAKRNFKDTSPLLGINFQVTPDALLYAKGSRGFRAGGVIPTVAQIFDFGPERATTYEAGGRFELFDRRLRINPTVFLTDWKNIQFNLLTSVSFFPGPLPIVANAGDARLKGFELEVQAAVTPRLMLTASGALLDSEYRRIDRRLAGRLTLASDLKQAPKAQFTLGGRYEAPVSGDKTLGISLNYTWQARQRSSVTDSDEVPIAAYGLLSGRIELRGGDHWRLGLFGTNLTGEKYLIGGTNYGRGGTIPTVAHDIGRPREYGINLRYDF